MSVRVGVVVGGVRIHMSSDEANAELQRQADEKKGEPKIYGGFVEHAYRLVFPFEQHFAQSPQLLTILPSGVVENRKVLEPKAEKGLIAYTYPQTIASEVATAEFLETPFVWKRDDGSLALMQTWPTSYNAKFKADFEITTSNPDPQKYIPQAVEEFGKVCTELFGAPAAEPPQILYCHRAAANDLPVYVGTRATLIGFLRRNPSAVEQLNLAEVTDDGFVTNVVDGKGNKSTKDFAMAEGEEYALYTKLGWQTMACVTPIHQFMPDRELLPKAA